MLADPLGLSAPGLSGGQVLVTGFGSLLILFGGLGRRVVGLYQGAALMLLNTLVFLLLVEVGAGVFSKLISLDSDDASTDDTRISQPYYTDQEWSAAYWNEFSTAEKFDYAPYVVWRRPPFSGQTINVDADHHRLTPGAECVAEAFTVFAFGGSTMWGTGAPDWGTIPAYLQEELTSQIDGPVCVVNFGQSAYVSPQAMIELMLQLKAGHVPDVVIFYDGVNDTFAAYQSGRADAHQNLSTLQDVFSGASQEPFAEIMADRLQENTYTVNLLNRLFDDPNAQAITYATMGISADDLAAQIVENYLENVALVDALAEVYGFEVGFFWQPVIFDGDKALTAYENGLRERNDPALVELFEATYAALRDSLRDYPKVHDLSDALDAQDATVYSDFMHITPPANAVIAEALLAALELPD
jgi:lysophospholipase L1-like esterase